MDLSLNEETKTLDFSNGGVVILQVSLVEAARLGVPFTHDVHNYSTIIIDDLTGVSARLESGVVILSINGVDCAELTPA